MWEDRKHEKYSLCAYNALNMAEKRDCPFSHRPCPKVCAYKSLAVYIHGLTKLTRASVVVFITLHLATKAVLCLLVGRFGLMESLMSHVQSIFSALDLGCILCIGKRTKTTRELFVRKNKSSVIE